MIPRKAYLDFLISAQDLQVIKVISGIRRCGKSTLLELFRHYLKDQGISDDQIIFINFEDMAYDELRDYKSLYKYIESKMDSNKMTYIFLDEIQHVSQFERAVDSLFIQKNVDLYITGSNAYFMSGELATLLSGRYIEVEMLPLSFSEFTLGISSTKSVSELYSRYLVNSSFPYTVQLGDNDLIIHEYLQGLYSTVILKDVITRNKISNVMMLEDVETLEKSVSMLNKLALEKDVQSKSQFARWVTNKEEHAQKIIETIANYYLTQRVKTSQEDYVERLKAHHAVIINAMKVKQNTDAKYVATLKESVIALLKYYPAEHKH